MDLMARTAGRRGRRGADLRPRLRFYRLRCRAAIAALLTLVFIGACRTAQGSLQHVDLAIENVTVIDPSRGRVLPSHDVYIRASRIVAVLPSRSGRRFA